MDKTCGNCGKFALEPFKQRGGACMGSFDRDICTYHSTSIHRDENNCPWCNGWIPKQEPIEQSYQQLSDVARGMLEEIKTMAGSYEYTADLDHEHKYEWIEDCIRPWREKLEELGVEL
jgi:hypothetical protein